MFTKILKRSTKLGWMHKDAKTSLAMFERELDAYLAELRDYHLDQFFNGHTPRR